MPETFKVPIEIQPPQPAQAVAKPAWAKRSPHNLRMGQSIASSVAAQAEATPQPQYTPVEQPASYQPHALPGATQENYQMENNGNQQPQAPQAPQPPDPMQYDFYSPEETARFHADNSAYMQSQIDAGIQRALEPHIGARQEAQWRDDYNSAVSRFGQDENFQEVMNRALEMCLADVKAGKSTSIEQKYAEASESTSRTAGQRVAHLPGRAKTIKGLGALIEHNHQTGRAKPFGNRNWRG